MARPSSRRSEEVGMAKYLFIESRDPFESADSQHFSELLAGIAARQNEATVFFVQNGVLPLRRGARYNDRISELIGRKVRLVADRFSLRERGISQVVDGVEVADIDRLVDLLLEPGVKAVWH
jgi:sulfur relay protein TusB/DsrH